MAFFGLAIIGLGETLANKRKGPRLIEGYDTWCALLCAYRTQITEELKEKLQKYIDLIK